MATPFTTYAFPLTSVVTTSTAERTDPTRWTDVYNAKDFGAVGDGVTDDTAAIQRLFDAAMGPYSNTNTGNGIACKKIFFPPGNYKVSPGQTTTITSASSNGSGGIRLLVNNTAGFTTGDMVYVRNVFGVPNANNVACSVVVIDGTHLDLFGNGTSGSGGLAWGSSSGYVTGNWTGTVTKPAIQTAGLNGTVIAGAGRVNTVITCTGNCAVLSVNGAFDTEVRDIQFANTGHGVGLDWNHDGSTRANVSGSGCGFVNVSAGGGNTDIAYYMGSGQFMTDTNKFYNCTVSMGWIGGIIIGNQNAVQNSIFGTQFLGVQDYASLGACSVSNASPCTVTINNHGLSPGTPVKFNGSIPTGFLTEATYYVTADGSYTANAFRLSDTQVGAMGGGATGGTANVNTTSTGAPGCSIQSGPGIYARANDVRFISGCGFQNYHGPDIRIDAPAPTSISGCRTESVFFVQNGQADVHISGCECASPYSGVTTIDAGFFVRSGGNVVLDACKGAAGIMFNITESIIINNCSFDETTVYSNSWGGSPNKPRFVQKTPKTTLQVTSTNYTIQPWDAARKLEFNSASATTVTINNSTVNYSSGTLIEMEQTGAGTVTLAASGVTVHSRGGLLNFNGQYAVAFLRCDGSSQWTFYGDRA